MLPRLLIATAVEAERAAVLARFGGIAGDPEPRVVAAGVGSDGAPAELEVVAVGVGPAAAAAGTARRLALAEAGGTPYDGVVCAGIGGGFAGRVDIGDVVVGTASVAADLGADSPDGFLPVDTLGFGAGRLAADDGLVRVPFARTGEILTVATATGTAERAERLAAAHPNALAEAMEGFGVAVAAAGAGLPYAEIRAISNIIGPRDTGAWRFDTAFAALTAVFTARKAAS